MTLLLILKICLSVAELSFSWTFALLFTVNLLMILKLMVLQNLIKNLNWKIFFSCDYVQFTLYCIKTDLFHYFSDSNTSLFQWRQASDNQKVKLHKVWLNYTVCKVFKNYRMQNMFRIWSSWVGGSVVHWSVVRRFNKIPYI